MKILLILPLFLLLSLIPSPGWSADFAKGVTAFENGDFATALKEWTPLAQQGDARAQFLLGAMYAIGQGVLQDDIYAHMWWNMVVVSSSSMDFVKLSIDGELDSDEKADKNIEILESRMTSADISAARKLARDCVASNYKGC